MINVKIDKGVNTMTFAGSGLEVAAEIGMIVHTLYTQLYYRAGPAIAKGCKEVLRGMLARQDSPVWDVNLDKNAGHSFFLEGDVAAAMTERLRRRSEEGGGSMTRVDLTKAQCAELANYLRGVLNNGMGAGSFDKIEMLVLARRALAAAEEVAALQKEWSDLCTVIGECGGLDRIKELAKADKDGRIAILPCEPGGVMLDMSDIERPVMMERLHFAVAYVRCGIVFHQPYKIFQENVTAGHIRPVSGWAGKMLGEEV